MAFDPAGYITRQTPRLEAVFATLTALSQDDKRALVVAAGDTEQISDYFQGVFEQLGEEAVGTIWAMIAPYRVHLDAAIAAFDDNLQDAASTTFGAIGFAQSFPKFTSGILGEWAAETWQAAFGDRPLP